MAQPTPNPASLQPGFVIGSYRLETPLLPDVGDGAWCARSLLDHSPVRLDVFYAAPATSPLIRMAFTLAKLPPHPHIAPVLDIVIQGEQAFLVTPYHPHTLADLPRPLEPLDAVTHGQAILEALHFLHEHHIVHGALAPACLGLEDGQIKVRGYGLMIDRLPPAGLLAYTSPWALEHPPTLHDDLWAVGIILFELLSGDLPFPHHNLAELRVAIRTLYPDPLPKTLPKRLRHIVARALERNLRRSYGSAKAMQEELAACAEDIAQGATGQRSSGSWPTFSVEPAELPPRHAGWWGLLIIALLSLVIVVAIWLTVRYFETKSTWQMRPPETIVAPAGGDFSTLATAVNAARTNTRILIRPGIYRGTVTLTKNVEIVAEGPPGAVVLESDAGPCMRQQLGSQIVRGVILRSTDWPAVQLDGGALTLEDCGMTTLRADGVVVSGQGTRLVLRRTHLSNGGGHGLRATDGAQIELVECDITEHNGDGVRLEGQSRLIARESRIAGNRQAGVAALENALARLERCLVERNGKAMFGNVEVASDGKLR